MEEHVVQSATERLFQYGVLGIFVVVFALVIFGLWREGHKERKEFITKLEVQQKAYTDRIESLQTGYITRLEQLQTGHTLALIQIHSDYDAKVERIWQLRLEDAKSYQVQFTELTKQGTMALQSVTQFLDTNKEAMTEVRNAMRELAEDFRSRR